MYGYESWTIKKGWVLKNWCLRTVMREYTLESPLDSKEIKLVNLKGNQPWMFIGRTDAEAEVLILWPPDSNSWLIGKDLNAEKEWEQEEKGVTEDEILDGIIDSWSLSKLQETMKYTEAWHAVVHGITKSWTQLEWLNNNNKSEKSSLEKVTRADHKEVNRII